MTNLKVIAFSRPIAVLAAEQQGLFEAQGLYIDWTITRGSVEQIRGLLAGQWDIAHTAADNVMAYVDREQVDLMVYWVVDLGIGQKLFVQPDCHSYHDLAGKILGVDALDTGYAFVLRRMLAQGGLTENQYQLRSVGGTRQRLDAMIAGETIGGLLSPPFDQAGLEHGFTLLEEASRVFPGYPGLTVATTQRWYREHADLFRSYAKALTEGQQWALDPTHRHAMVDYLAQDQAVDRDSAERRFTMEVASIQTPFPSLAQVETGLAMVRQLREDMTGVHQPLTRYWNPEVMQALARA